MMGRFFAPNISRPGRWARVIWGLGLIAVAVALFTTSRWASGLLAAAGGFSLFEAARGWCVLRACGIKTKL